MLADVALVSGVAHFVCGLSAEMLKRLIEIHDNLVFRPKVKVKLRRIPHAVLSRRVRKIFRISRGRHRVAQCFRIYDMRTVTVFAGGVMPDDDLRLESAEIFDLPFEKIVVAVSCVCKHLHSALAGFRIEVGKYADHGVISDARRPKSVKLLMRSDGRIRMLAEIDDLHRRAVIHRIREHSGKEKLFVVAVRRKQKQIRFFARLIPHLKIVRQLSGGERADLRDRRSLREGHHDLF